jgi:hypothetical protein
MNTKTKGIVSSYGKENFCEYCFAKSGGECIVNEQVRNSQRLCARAQKRLQLCKKRDTAAVKSNIDRIKKGLECCRDGKCYGCPYEKGSECFKALMSDVLEILEDEKEIKILLIRFINENEKLKCNKRGEELI